MALSVIALRAVAIFGLLAGTVPGVAPTAAAEPGDCDPGAGQANACAGQPPQTWPVAQGNFTSPGDPGWVFFKPFFGPAGFTGPKADELRSAQYGCGIGPSRHRRLRHGTEFGVLARATRIIQLRRQPLPAAAARNQPDRGGSAGTRPVHPIRHTDLHPRSQRTARRLQA